MKKYTFEELVDNESYTIFEKFDDEFENVVDVKNVIKLLEQVRQATLQEAADKADADYTLIGLGEVSTFEDNLEVYVLKSSILDLDKDSIEVDE